MTTTIVGLGKIGLPLAVQFASKGETVLGVDVNLNLVELINEGIEPFPGEENLASALKSAVLSGKLRASSNLSESVSRSDVVLVVVPLLVNENGDPNFEIMDLVTIEIGNSIKPRTLVSYETTLPIGTTRSRFSKSIEKQSGLKVGRDFFVVFSPERVLTGRVFTDLRRYPKIVGGVTDECTTRGADFYSRVLEFDDRPDLSKANGVWSVESADTAEFIKLAETTYRDVNIGLANQFALHAREVSVDMNQVIEAANSQHFSNIHDPGIAVGGHCIPVYPRFYLWNNPKASIVRAARETNRDMPKEAIGILTKEGIQLRDASVCIFGATYRAGVKETAYSGVFELEKQLRLLGSKVEVYDPLLSDSEIRELGLMPLSNPNQMQIGIIQNYDRKFVEMLKDADLFKDMKLLLDGRNLIKPDSQIRNIKVVSILRP